MKSALMRIILTSFALALLIPNIASAETKIFIKEYTYQASEEDSRDSGRTIALREVKRLFLEDLGTYLESIKEVKNLQLTKDQIVTLTAGIVQMEVVDEKWDDRTYWLRARITVDSGSIIKNIDAVRSNPVKANVLEELRKRADDQLREIARLRKELVMAKGEDRARGRTAYDNAVKNITAIDWFEKGFASGISGDVSHTINAYTKAIGLNPKYAEFYNYRGNAYSNLGNYKQAVEDYNKAIELYRAA